MRLIRKLVAISMDIDEEYIDDFDEIPPQQQEFVDYMLPLVDLDPRLKSQIGEMVVTYAFQQGNTRLRPLQTNRTTPAARSFVPPPNKKLEMNNIVNDLNELLDLMETGQVATSDELEGLLAESVVEISNFYFMPPLPPKNKRKSRKPTMTSVAAALAYLNGNSRLFAEMFCGWSSQMVVELCSHLVLYIPALSNTYSCEERILCVLARFKQSVASWEMQGFHFGRGGGTLCTMFTVTVKLILDKFSGLISLDGLARIPQHGLDQSTQAVLNKYRKFKKDPEAELPDDYNGSNCLGDGKHVQIGRPGGDHDADVQRSFWTKYKKAHTINTLFVVLINGIRVYTGFASGRHADPYLYTDELHAALHQRGCVMLCDSIFAPNEVCRPMKGLDDDSLEPIEKIFMSALRIPVEWCMLMVQDMPLLDDSTKLKLFHTRPRSLIEMGTLLANFKLCLKGENITTYFGVLPPTLDGYLNGKLFRDPV